MNTKRSAPVLLLLFGGLLVGCQSTDDDEETGAGSGGGGACVEPAELAGITAAHNSVRRAVASGEPLPQLVWSCDVAAVAQAYADELRTRGCDLEHSSNDYGENLFWSSGASAAEDVVAAWASEEACYSHGEFPAECTPRAGVCGSCGHYTQIVWRDTRRLGCGVARCGSSEVWVCNYDPPGNFVGEYPY